MVAGRNSHLKNWLGTLNGDGCGGLIRLTHRAGHLSKAHDKNQTQPAINPWRKSFSGLG